MTVLNLEQIRRRTGVSLEAITDKTKISARFLRAIEAEEFEKLPGGVFNTSYIRQYACSIGFAEERLLALYNARMKPDPEVLPAPAEKVWDRLGLRSCFNWLRAPSSILERY
ncbi:MAG TPA: helix-turn-helix domain-containing protein [Bryobacteraceae bacterium]|nr:helix-turn-helix domain-containing protein [Bryobacteraceae bacterium]